MIRASVILTREEAHDLRGIQGDEVRWTAEQVLHRGPVWMRRQAMEYRRTKILLSRETGGNGTNLRRFNVRASLFVVAVLRACAARVETENHRRI